MVMVNVLSEDWETVIGRVEANTNLDYWDGYNLQHGGLGRHLGITTLKTGELVLVYTYQWQGIQNRAEIVSDGEALQAILRADAIHLLEEPRFKRLKDLYDADFADEEDSGKGIHKYRIYLDDFYLEELVVYRDSYRFVGELLVEYLSGNPDFSVPSDLLDDDSFKRAFHQGTDFRSTGPALLTIDGGRFRVQYGREALESTYDNPNVESLYLLSVLDRYNHIINK